jgi:Zn-dependent oligopeptidase
VNNKLIINKEIIDDNDFDMILSILTNDMDEYSSFHSMCSFLQYVSKDQDVRESCSIADQMLSSYTNELNMNVNVYNKIIQLFQYGKDNNLLDTIDIIFFNKLILGYERQGIKLDNYNRTLLLRIKDEITKIEKRILINYIDESQIKIGYTLDELKGLPNNYIDRLPIISRSPVKYGIELNKSNYSFCMKYISNDTVRRDLEYRYNTKGKPIINDILRLYILRNKQAKLLSYKNHSEYKIETQLARSTETVKVFLTDFLKRLDYRFNKEISTIKKIKKVRYDNKETDDNYNQINSWDIPYYLTKWKKEYGVNDKLIKEFFPILHVIINTMRIYEKLFNIKIIHIVDNIKWYDDVLQYKVLDNKEVKGYFYLDLYKREGKYNQIRCYSLQQGSKNKLPISALVSSFDKPNNKKQILLSHLEVITFFHEFGHIVHQILGRTKYSLLSGTNTEDDFVETPAQVLENLCWDPNILKLLSCHYKTKEVLPNNLIDKLIKIKNINVGINYKSHILVAIYDQLVHSSEVFLNEGESLLRNKSNNKDSIISFMEDFYRQLYNQIFPNINYNEGTFMPISWINFINNMEGICYSRLWSKVDSSFIYLEKFHGKDYIEAGQEFKNNILSKGGSIAGKRLLYDYLNKRTNLSGFLKLYNLDIDTEFSFFFNTDTIKNNEISTNTTINISSSDEYNLDTNYETETVIYSNRFSECCSDTYTENINSVEYFKSRLDNNNNHDEVDNNIFIKKISN